MFNFSKPIAAAAVLATLCFAPANAQIFKGETAGVGDPVHTMFVTFANQANKAGVEIQVNAGQTLINRSRPLHFLFQNLNPLRRRSSPK